MQGTLKSYQCEKHEENQTYIMIILCAVVTIEFKQSRNYNDIAITRYSVLSYPSEENIDWWLCGALSWKRNITFKYNPWIGMVWYGTMLY